MIKPVASGININDSKQLISWNCKLIDFFFTVNSFATRSILFSLTTRNCLLIQEKFVSHSITVKKCHVA